MSDITLQLDSNGTIDLSLLDDGTIDLSLIDDGDVVLTLDGISTFQALSDTPPSYSGQSGKTIAVKSTEDGIEFSDSGTGDAVGPSSSVDENITVFDSTTGKIIKDSGVNISAVNANTAKTGITAQQSTDITTNNSKISYTDSAAVGLNTTHRGLTNNPHTVTATQVGLGNVTDDAQVPLAGGTITGLLNIVNPTITPADVIFSASSGITSIKTELFARGTQRWDIANGLGEYKGSIQYSTPGDNPGIIFRGATELGRTDIGMDTQTGGFEIGTSADNSNPPTQFLIEPDNNVSVPLGNLTVTVGNIIVGGTVDGIDIATDVAANTAKTSNATHTGDVTGDTALTIANDAVDIAMLAATGTPSSSTFLRGDNTWSTPSGSGDVSKVGTPVDNQLGVWTGDGTIEGTADLIYDGNTFDILKKTNIFNDTSHGELIVGNNNAVAADNLGGYLYIGKFGAPQGSGSSVGAIYFESKTTDSITHIAGVQANIVQGNTTRSLTTGNLDFTTKGSGMDDPRSRLRMDENGNIGFGGEITDFNFTGADMVLKNGNLGIGIVTASEKLDVVGNIAVSGTVDGIDIATDVAANTTKTSYTKTNIMGTVVHGATAGTARPSGFDVVTWIGNVEPTNATDDDVWVDTA